MLMQVAAVAGALFGGLVLVAIVVLLAWRAKSPIVLKPLIRLQRAVINPRQMQSAGSPGAYAAVIRHRGRVTGRSLETPVGAVAVDDGFVIALVYGSHTNWCQNVLASGSATIVHEGRTYEVEHPEIIPMREVETQFAAGDQRGFRWLAVDEALRVRRVEPEGTGEWLTDAARSDHAKAPAVEATRSMEARHVA